MSKIFNVAMMQIASSSTNPDLEARKADHLGIMEKMVREITFGQPLTDMFVFPELYIPGVDPVNYYKMAEKMDGPSLERVCKLAKECKRWIVPGSIFEEIDGKHVYNTAVMISPDGEVVLKYRKVFIPYPLEPSMRGNEFPVYEIPGVGTVGIMICADAHVPEIARNLAFKGAEIIIKPTYQGYWIGNIRNHTDICKVRAIENQCYIVSVNQPAPLCMGNSCTVDPEGRVVESLECCEGYTIASIDVDAVKNARQSGSFGAFQFLTMLRDAKVEGIPVDECYIQGFENSPLFVDKLKEKAPKVPWDLKHPNSLK